MDISKITSSKKLAKIGRKYYRKEVRASARDVGRELGNALKTKPAWCPWFLWMAGLKIFIKINTGK